MFAAGLALVVGAPFSHFLRAALEYAAISLGVRLLSSTRSIFNWLISNGVQSALTEAYLSHAAHLRLEVRLHPAFHDLHGRVRVAASREPGDNVVVKLMTLVRYVLNVFGIAAGLIAISPVLAGAAVLATVPSFLESARLSWQKRALALGQSRRQNMLQYLEGLLTSRTAAAEIRAYGLGEHLLGRWRALLRTLQEEQWDLSVRTRPVAIALYIASNGLLGYALGILWALWLVAHGRLDVAAFATAAAALYTFRQHLEIALVHLSLTQGQSLELSDLFAFLDAPLTEQTGPSATRPFPSPLREGITVENLGFTYPGRDRPALRGVSFRLKPGEKVALVGPNGAGKSTLVRCLLGLYHPTEGQVLFDGVPQELIDPASLRAHVAAVFQEHARFRLTLREAIGFGRIQAMHDDATVLAAAHCGGAGDVLRALPAGLATWLDRTQPGGVDLSGGEWQRIATARAFMREAELLILDEPTAALDPRAEAEVFHSFLTMAEGRTAVLISHRLGFARMADRILVLEDGRLVEEGTHPDLVARGGLYAQMWAAQRQWYTA
jgi:ATP-binding cassette subfamily B protein